jgi:uncharacterized membrane protein
LSADGITLGIVLCATAATFRATLRTEALGFRDLAQLALLFSLLALCKQAYAPLALMFFMIPSRNCGGWLRYLGAAALVFGVPIGLNLAWASVVKPLFFPIMPGVDPVKHLYYTLSRPFGYSCEVINVMYDRDMWLDMMGKLGWLSIKLPKAVRWALWVSLAASAVFDGDGQHRLAGRTRLQLLGLCLLAYTMILTLVNLSWHAAGVEGIVGIQARYFVPLLPLLMTAIRVDYAWQYARSFAWFKPIAIISVALLGSIASWVALFQFYYQ